MTQVAETWGIFVACPNLECGDVSPLVTAKLCEDGSLTKAETD
jgi:hypothetical protein